MIFAMPIILYNTILLTLFVIAPIVLATGWMRRDRRPDGRHNP